jgi:hypothetical protein
MRLPLLAALLFFSLEPLLCAAESSGSSDRYARIAEKNIFYPRSQSAAAAVTADGAPANPGGSGLLLTGLIRHSGKVFCLVENRASGESKVLAPGDATGAGEIIDATIDGITLSTEAGLFSIPVGYYLSGQKGPDVSSAPAPSQPPQPGQSPATASASPGRVPGAGDAGGFRRGGRARGDRGQAEGGRPQFTPEQIEAFRQRMSPEQRERVERFMRQTPTGRTDTGSPQQ